jgi:hypothetical protein
LTIYQGHTFANPFILSIIGTHYYNQIVARCIKGVKEIRHDPQKPETSGENDELIFVAELVEQILLIFLSRND